jgi:hypothetical protein
MNKEKYLQELEKRLVYLKNEEKQQEIFRISNELDSGKIVKDISEEIKEIYQKYNIDISKKERQANNKFLNKLNDIAKCFDNFLKKMKKNSLKDNAIILRDIILLILLVSILKIPFIGLETILFSTFNLVLSSNILNLLNFIIEVAYVIFAIVVFIKIFKKRFKEELK